MTGNPAATTVFSGAMVALIVVLLVLLLCPSKAPAYEDPTWWDDKSQLERETTMDFLYKMGPQGVVPYPGEPATQADAFYADVPGGFSSEPQETDLTRQIIESLVGVGLIQNPRPTTIEPDVFNPWKRRSLALLSFSVGYAIGTGLNTLFFRIGLEDGAVQTDHGPGQFCFTAGCAPHLYWANYGDPIYYGSTVQQVPGAYLYSATLDGNRYTPVRWFDPPCTFSGYSPPPGAQMQSMSAGVNCWLGYGTPPAPITVQSPYRTNPELFRELPHPYDPEEDGQPDIQLPAPADPGIGTAEERAEEQLEGDKELLRAWLDWLSDPDKVPKENPLLKPVPGRPGEGFNPTNQCNPALFGIPRYIFRRKPGYTGDPPSAIKATYPAVEDPTTGGFSTVYLRYGETAGYLPEGAPPGDRAQGWGYRHIAYKHGWGEGDATHTALALLQPSWPPYPNQGSSTSFVYDRSYTGGGGAFCIRRVIVEFNDDPNDTVNGPKFVVTSFVVGG